MNELIGKKDKIGPLKKSNKNKIDENFKLRNDLTNSVQSLKEKDKIVLELETKLENLEKKTLKDFKTSQILHHCG